MRYGAMNFPVTPVLEEIETFSRLGFDYLELTMDPPMAHHTKLSAIREKIIQALAENNMGIVCHLPTFVTTADLTESLRQASVNEMRRSLDVAASLGAKKIVFHPSMVTGMGAFVMDTVRKHAFDFICEMADAAKRLNVTLCLENMFPRCRLGVEPDDLAQIFNVVPALKLTLDTGHANIGDRRGRRLREMVSRFGKRIGHLHFSDNQGSVDDHLAVGQGTVNFSWLTGQLSALGYDDTITLEVFDENRSMLVESRKRIERMIIGARR